MLPDNFETARILLQPVSAGDDDAIFNTYAQDEAVSPLSHLATASQPQRDSSLYPALSRHSARGRAHLHGSGREDNHIRGAFALRQRAPHRLDCGYVLASQWQRQGLMTEILTEVVRWALQQPSLFRIGAVCDVENIGSARVLEKCGFVRGACCAAGLCIRTSVTSHATATAMRVCAHDRPRMVIHAQLPELERTMSYPVSLSLIATGCSWTARSLMHVYAVSAFEQRDFL